MAHPAFLLNTSSQRVSTLLKADGTPLYPMAVGQKGTTYDDDGGWMATATHEAGEPLATGDGVTVLAGIDEGDGETVRPILVDIDGRVLATVSPSSGALVDRSDDITTGGTRQQVAAALVGRKYFFFQNVSDTEMWINFGTNAVADSPSIKVVAGGYYESSPAFCSAERVDVMCATTGKKYTAKEA